MTTGATSSGAAGLLNQAVIDEAEDLRRRARFPVGAALQFADMEEAGRESALDRLRVAEPVSWVPALGGWLITSRAAARDMLVPNAGATVEVAENLVRASLGTMMLTSDGAEHTRLRTPFERPFRGQEAAELFTRYIAGECDSLLRPLVSVGAAGSAELGAAFAAPFAVRMAARVLGLSLDDTELIDSFYVAFAEGMVYDGDPTRQQRADQARDDLNEILARELRKVRATPDRSITSVVAHDPETALTDDELIAQLRVVMFGSIETIQASVLNTILLLLQHPEQLAAVRADMSLVAGAVEESLRMIPPVAFIERWTRLAITLDGIDIGAHEFVGMSVLAVNRDPATFVDPLLFDIRRGNARKALSFSFGEHHCLGIHLARLQTVTAVTTILEAMPRLRLLDHEPPAGFAFRRPARLVVEWD